MRFGLVLLSAVLAAACPGGPDGPSRPDPPASFEPLTLSIVGTNDLHGHIDRLPLLAGYVGILRDARDGRVVLVDAGDMFQGTLESNLTEGAAVIDAYNAMGYTAACVGNHEFDFGPVGERATPESAADDARGALKARGAQAKFPVLVANVRDAKTDARVDWPNMPASTMRTVGGVEVGIVGVTTKDTPYTTIATNFVGLEMMPLVDVIESEATSLRRSGADVVIVAAHAGAKCKSFADPTDLGSCASNAEIFDVARALPAGLVDVIVAGHTHAGVAHEVNGIAIIESFSYGAAFGRVDVTVTPGKAVSKTRVFPPRYLCKSKPPPCEPGDYEGRPVQPDPAIASVIAGPMADADDARRRPVGVTIESEIKRSYAHESALGNLFADLMLAARPAANVAITNGGGLRADLPKGDLVYGDLYRAMPFDNQFALVTMNGAQLRELLAANLRGEHGIFSVSGVTVDAQCNGSELVVELRRGGKAVADDAEIVLVTSDFLAAGGDGMVGRLGLPDGAIEFESGVTIRDEMAKVMGKRGGKLSASQLFDPDNRRMSYPGSRPVSCPPGK